jgi:hypothetical protein
MVIGVDDSRLVDRADGTDTTIVINEAGPRALVRLLGGFGRDEYGSRGISDEEASFFDGLWGFLGGSLKGEAQRHNPPAFFPSILWHRGQTPKVRVTHSTP